MGGTFSSAVTLYPGLSVGGSLSGAVGVLGGRGCVLDVTDSLSAC